MIETDLRQFKDNGFAPVKLDREMVITFHDYCERRFVKLKAHEHLDSQSEWEDLMKKSRRLFDSEVVHVAEELAGELGDLFGINKAQISGLSDSEILEIHPSERAIFNHHKDFFWRAARPFKPDVAKPHNDYVFLDKYKNTSRMPRVYEFGNAFLKCWIPLHGVDVSNSLWCIPGSHKENLSSMYLDSARPGISSDWFERNESRAVAMFQPEWIRAGNIAVVFDYGLVHWAPSNGGNELRRSCEFTFVGNR